jgi:hypothetical protein
MKSKVCKDLLSFSYFSFSEGKNMKIVLFAFLLALAGPTSAERKRRALKNAPLVAGSRPQVTFQPGCFDRGNFVYE